MVCSDDYDWLFNQLQATKIPYLAVAGNHDVTHEWHSFGTPRADTCADFYPIDALKIAFGTFQAGHDWQILLLNSSVSGEIFGLLTHEALLWPIKPLTTHLNKPSSPYTTTPQRSVQIG